MNYSLSVSADVPLPIHVQVIEQIKWFIVLGLLKPGDVLFPAAQLADLLQVNRNTIQSAYAQLREEGILDSRKGYGTWVAEGEATFELIREREPLGRFLKDTFEEARDSGHDLARFVQLSSASIQLRAGSRMPGLTLVASREEEYRFLLAEIERLAGTEASLILLEELEDAEEKASADEIVLTTTSSAEEWRHRHHLLSPPMIIESVLDPVDLFELASTASEQRTVIVGAGRKGVERIDEQLRALGADFMILTAAEWEDAQQSLHAASRVYALPSAYESIAPKSAAAVKRLGLRLEKSSEYGLRSLSKAEFPI